MESTLWVLGEGPTEEGPRTDSYEEENGGTGLRRRAGQELHGGRREESLSAVKAQGQEEESGQSGRGSRLTRQNHKICFREEK